MKNILLLSLLLLSIRLSAQQTYLKKLSFSNLTAYVHPDDSVCNVNHIIERFDGSLITASKINRDDQQIQFLSGTNPVINIDTAHHSTLSAYLFSALKNTMDSGFVYSKNYSSWASTSFSTSLIKKYDKNLNLQWTYNLGLPSGTAPDQRVWDIAIAANSDLYCIIGDSIYVLDQYGILQNHFSSLGAQKLSIFPNGDLLYCDGTSLSRKDNLGSTVWSLSCSNLFELRNSYLYVISGSSVQSVNPLTGSVIWTYPLTVSSAEISGIDICSSGSLLISINTNPGQVIKIDASGNLVWQHNYNFPLFGLGTIKELSSGSLVTGGTYKNGGNFPFSAGNYEFSTFIATLDSMGEGKIDSTSTFWPMDANHDSIISFTNDILYVSLAQGATGWSREPNLFSASNFDFDLSDFGTDWNSSFGIGVNHKHADCNGDGTVDSLDFQDYSHPFAQYPVHTFTRIGNNQSHTRGTAVFRITPEYAIVQAGDTMRFYLIAGTGTQSFDSLFGFALQLSFNNSLIDTAYFQAKALDSDLGMTSEIRRIDNKFMQAGIVQVMLSRNDQQFRNNINDTLATMTFIANTNITTIQNFNLFYDSFKAISSSGSDISLNLLSDPVQIDSFSVGINKTDYERSIKVYPNPADEFLKIHDEQKLLKAYCLKDILGNVVSRGQLGQSGTISCSQLAPGIYFVELSDNSNFIKNEMVLIRH